MTLLALAALAISPASSAPPVPPLLAPDARGAAAPDRAFDMVHLQLDLALDPAASAVSGVATWTVRRLGDGPLVLDQVALQVTDVRDATGPLAWHLAGNTLVIDVKGDAADVAVTYHATPRNGLHFRQPGGSDAYAEVWSQGEDTDNRYWFPGWDHPNDRFVYDGKITAPAGWKVLTNSGQDLVNYLVMVAAGPYDVHGDDTTSVWVPPGTTEAGIRRVRDPLPSMLAHFAARTGVAYPWGPYRQVFVQRFLYTGMENTSATIEDRSLVAGPSVEGTRRRRTQSVVAHELAHQWFGDFLTCRSWRELWLNEGFATYFAADWQATVEGEDNWASGVARRYDASKKGPALARRFHAGADAPDNTNVYNKGASVLQMLRVMLGEDAFWAGMRRYVQGHGRTLVETDDLADAMEAASGQELGWFFQQWVELPYVPKLTVESRTHDGMVTVTVRQITGDERPIYTLPIEIEVGTANGPVRQSAWLTDEDVEITVPVPGDPTYVAFDPRGGLLADVTQTQEPAAWEAQLASPSPYARIRATDALADTDASAGLARVATDPKASFALRAAAVDALGEQRAVALLLPLLADPDDELRARTATAVGKSVGTSGIPGLRALVERDPNPDVQGTALEALANLDGSLAAKLALTRLRIASRDEDQLLGAALRVVGDHGTPRDLDPLLRVTGPGRGPIQALTAAAHLVARQDAGQARDALQARIARAAEALLDDPDRRTREGAVALLGQLGDTATAARLEAFRREETLTTLRDAAAAAITNIRAHATPDAKPNELEARIDALERELADLKKADDKH